MNIAIVSHTYPTKHDPSSGIFIQKESRLVSEFAEVNVIIPSVVSTPLNKQYYRGYQPVKEPFPVTTFKYVSIPRRSFPSITKYSLSNRLLNIVKNLSPDIVHLHALFPSGISAKTLNNSGFKIVLTVHGGDWYSNLENRKMMKLVNESMHNAHQIIAVGQKLKSDIISKFPELASQTIHIPHGIDTQKFIPPKSKTFSQKNLGWNPLKKNILAVANLYEVKGIHILVKAFAHLEEFENYHLHLVAPRHQKDTKQKIIKLLEEHNLQRHVSFYPSLSEHDLISYYQSADLFVSPSLKEGFGLAIAEAAACGVPVLATRSGGPEEILDPKIGYLVKVNSTDAIIQGIEKIIQELDQFSPIVMNNYISDNFGLTKKKEHLNKIYSKVLTES